LLRRPPRSLTIDVSRHDTRAGAGEFPGIDFAESFTATGDDNDPSLEIEARVDGRHYRFCH
jgi:hypothetical protein